MPPPLPQRIHRGERDVVVTWTDAHVATVPARELRLACQCALCQEEMTGRPLLDPAAVPADVRPVSITLVGSYAVRITWSDGHDTGIYTYEWLWANCPCERCRGGEPDTRLDATGA
jgi:ATP-binding protein involved in chromosome partitioning